MVDTVSYRIDNRISTITLDRPEKYNALTVEMWRKVTEYVNEAADDDARVIILTGAGEIFCSGDDISALDAIEDECEVRELTNAVLGAFSAIENSPLPVVGQANGSAYGGGFELLLAADLTVAPKDAVFSLPEARIGAYPFYGAKRLARLVGRQRAADLALTGREIPATEAVDWGLFARAVPKSEVEEEAATLAAKLKQASPSSLDTTKSWLNASLAFPGENDAMRMGLGYLFAGSDAREGAQAFLENRKPDYAE